MTLSFNHLLGCKQSKSFLYNSIRSILNNKLKQKTCFSNCMNFWMRWVYPLSFGGAGASAGASLLVSATSSSSLSDKMIYGSLSMTPVLRGCGGGEGVTSGVGSACATTSRVGSAVEADACLLVISSNVLSLSINSGKFLFRFLGIHFLLLEAILRRFSGLKSLTWTWHTEFLCFFWLLSGKWVSRPMRSSAFRFTGKFSWRAMGVCFKGKWWN